MSQEDIFKCIFKFFETNEEFLKDTFQSVIDESMQELAEQIDKNMDFVERKLDVFNKAIDLQSATMEEALDIKEKDMQQTLEDFRMQIEAEFKKKNRSGADFTIEKGRIYKSLDEIERKMKLQVEIDSLIAEGMGCLLESDMIQTTLISEDAKEKEYVIIAMT